MTMVSTNFKGMVDPRGRPFDGSCTFAGRDLGALVFSNVSELARSKPAMLVVPSGAGIA